jgi:transcriptional regulator with XRE-family HTH domain
MKDNFYSQSSERLKSERIRLGLNQAQAGELCGVSREMWGKYERGDAVPGGEVLFSFVAAGADVQYIFTGIRSSYPPNEDEPPTNCVDLNIKKMTKVMRNLSDKQQAELINQAEEKQQLNQCKVELEEFKKKVG